MVIYYAMTNFHMIFSLLHRNTIHKDDKSVLFLYSEIGNRERLVERTLETKLFDEVYIVPEIKLRECWKTSSDSVINEMELENNINNWANAFHEWLPFEIPEDAMIYCANDQWALGNYCISHGRPYYYYEDGVGMLSKPEYSLQLVANMNVMHGFIAEHIKAFGLNDFVIEKIADLENQSPGFSDPKARHYSVKEELSQSNDDLRRKILHVFNAPSIHNTGGSILLLTEHFINMRRLSITGQAELYSYIVDYFGRGKQLYIKPHPNDIHLNYTEIFPNAICIERLFPSELLPFCIDNKFDIGLAACSTAVYGLKNIFLDTVRFGIDIEHTYSLFHRYYASAVLAKQIESTATIYVYGAITEHYKMFFKLLDVIEYHVIDRELPKDSGKIKFIIVDAVASDDVVLKKLLDELCENDIVLFLNSSEDYCFSEAESDIFNRIANLDISLKSKQEAWIETIYLYSKSEKQRRTFGGDIMRKELKYSNLSITMKAFSEEKHQIKFLEGVLRATTKQLEYVTNREDKLATENALLKEKLEQYEK
ncbi:glycosyltransferase family 52 [Eubacteriales bacterium OttesenSCG-928-A19]|nr:glycosyltransferase family 52 [Eubacteriales bacterium OttesenSCG-928-A19]